MAIWHVFQPTGTVIIELSSTLYIQAAFSLENIANNIMVRSVVKIHFIAELYNTEIYYKSQSF